MLSPPPTPLMKMKTTVSYERKGKNGKWLYLILPRPLNAMIDCGSKNLNTVYFMRKKNYRLQCNGNIEAKLS